MAIVKHYGVRGMKWGVRKTRASANRKKAFKSLVSAEEKFLKDDPDAYMDSVFGGKNRNRTSKGRAAFESAEKKYRSALSEDVKATIAEGGRFIKHILTP